MNLLGPAATTCSITVSPQFQLIWKKEGWVVEAFPLLFNQGTEVLDRGLAGQERAKEQFLAGTG